MGFSRCGHSVTRRIKAPAALSGADFAGVKGYYDLWQIDSFQRDQVVMNRVLPLFCPLHTVLSCDEAGNVVLCENMYGDGMAVKETTPYSLSDFDEACQEQLLLSLGFDSREDALAWLSSH